MVWKQAMQGPFTNKEALEHAKSILKSAKNSPYLSEKDKEAYKTTVKKKGKGFQVYYWV